MTKIVEELRRGVNNASHVAVLLLVLTGVAMMHIEVSSLVTGPADGSSAGAAQVGSVIEPSVLSSTAPIGARVVDERLPPNAPIPDEDHHGAVIACCLLAFSGIASLVVRRTSRCISRSPATAVIQHMARDIAVLIERSRPPDRPRFALGVIRT